MGFPDGSDGKASVCNSGDWGSIPGSVRSPGEGNGNPFQYSCLDGKSMPKKKSHGRRSLIGSKNNPMDGGAMESQRVGHD